MKISRLRWWVLGPPKGLILDSVGCEYVIPLDVLLSLEKNKDATVKNVTATAEARKRKGGGVSKALAKKAHVDVLEEVSASSSSGGSSSSASSGSSKPAGGLVAPEPMSVVGSPAVVEPSPVAPLPSLLGGDSSDKEAPVGEAVAFECPPLTWRETLGRQSLLLLLGPLPL